MGKNVLRIRQCFDPQWFQSHGFYPGKCRLLRQMSFHIWKFIKACQKSCIRTFTDRCTCSVLDHKDRSLFYGAGFLRCFYGKFFYSSMLSGKAKMPQRAFFALCCSVWNTDYSSQLHHSLVEIPRSVLRHLLCKIIFHRFPYRLFHDISTVFGESCVYPQHISIYCRDFLSVGNGRNGTCRISSYSF